ncbi:killer cell lectin-like receptor, subfamily A, member 1 [Rattus norvegicus]|uniref:Ly49 inhibitory receptor 6 n=1 Tax=Rattus norvegicus TaxID=10116 RepID=Q5MPW4_RAT|nr:killer cell lectin-like receptor, subfamily A, member 1 [Rattus norvegicus]AAV74515.1 Ly49 inhibitory receptor 6 [Rattus norvegicus]|eukprot:NP_001009718.1 killer cell lectin-like receptor, subfamily A, member 2 [Rattus norvegicus]
MCDQEVTYSTVRFHKSSGLQNQERAEETQGPIEAGHRKCSVLWQHIKIALGILCSHLLVTLAVLALSIIQYSQENHDLQKTLKHHHNCSTMQSIIDLKEEMMRNKSIECRSGSEYLDSLKREQERWYRKTKTILNSTEHIGKGVKIHWFCYGIKCYYFIMVKKSWNGCQQTCQNSSLPLLKIDHEEELKFLQIRVISDNYWIGLKYHNEEKGWAWTDNGESKLVLSRRKFNLKDGGCVFLSKRRLENTKCDNSYSCICGKTLDKFPG